MLQGTIQSATPGNQWQGRHGQFLDYTVQLDNGGPFILSRKLQGDGSHKPVTVGAILAYEIKEQGDHGTKIKEVNPEFAGQGNGNGAAPSGGVSNDARQDSIERQVAAKCAAEVLSAQVASGKPPSAGLTAQFDKLTNEFHKTIRGYTVEQPAATPLPTADVPADTEGIDTPAPEDDSDIPF